MLSPRNVRGWRGRRIICRSISPTPPTPMRAIAEIRERLDGGRLDALVNNAAISPKGAGGSRLSAFETEPEDWRTIFQVNFFAPMMLARGLIGELEKAHGSIVNVTSIAGARVHPFAGAAYATSKAALAALTREMASDLGPSRHTRQRDFARRDRHRDPVAGHRQDRRANPDAPPRFARRSRQGDLLSLLRTIELCAWRRNPHQWRPARVNKAAIA